MNNLSGCERRVAASQVNSSRSSPRNPVASCHGFRLSRHRLIPIDVVGVAPVECRRVGEALEEERHEQVSKPSLDRIGHDLPLKRAESQRDVWVVGDTLAFQVDY